MARGQRRLVESLRDSRQGSPASARRLRRPSSPEAKGGTTGTRRGEERVCPPRLPVSRSAESLRRRAGRRALPKAKKPGSAAVEVPDAIDEGSVVGDEGPDLRKNGLTRFEWPVNLASPGERTVSSTRAMDSFEPDCPAPESGIGKTSAASILGWDRAGSGQFRFRDKRILEFGRRPPRGVAARSRPRRTRYTARGGHPGTFSGRRHEEWTRTRRAGCRALLINPGRSQE